MATNPEHWSTLRADGRWAELWHDVELNGTDHDVYELIRQMSENGELADPAAQSLAVDVFKRTARGLALHERNVERAQALAASEH